MLWLVSAILQLTIVGTQHRLNVSVRLIDNIIQFSPSICRIIHAGHDRETHVVKLLLGCFEALNLCSFRVRFFPNGNIF